jgi:hypothetical protein
MKIKNLLARPRGCYDKVMRPRFAGRKFLRAMGERMKRKIYVLVLMLASAVIFLPVESLAATAAGDRPASVSSDYNYAPQIRVQIGRGRRRGWNRNRRWNRDRWNRGRTVSVQRRGFRMVRQTYWRNGRRYTRTVRVYQ